MRRTALIITSLCVAAVTLLGAARGQVDQGRESTTCSPDSAASLTGLVWVEFYACIDRLFNERFPYRDALRHANAWVDYYVFRSSQIPKVYVGRDGWLNSRDELRDYQKDGCDQAQAMRDLARQLHELGEVIEASGRIFIFTVAPNKSTIYPEYVGLSRSPTCGKCAYDLLLEAFGDYPVKQFVRLDELLLEAKQQDQIYYKTDTHWNEVGVLIVARTLLQSLAPDKWHDYLGEVVMTTSLHRGDLSTMMGLHMSEMAPSIQTGPRETVSMENRSPNALNIRHDWVSPVASGHAILPRAVFYRDSFMNVPLWILGGAFAQIDAYWTEGGMIHLPMAGSETALRLSQIVLVEVVERNLTYLKINVDAFREVFRNPSGDT